MFKHHICVCNFNFLSSNKIYAVFRYFNIPCLLFIGMWRFSFSVHSFTLTLSNPIFLPTVYSPALIYLSLPFSYKHNCANTMHNHLFTSKHVACRETERVQPALSVGRSPYYMRKSVRQAPTAERAQQKRVGHLPTSERNGKIIMSDEVRRRIGKG
jgi:hypothetical protein